jgi:hypothetical protein
MVGCFDTSGGGLSRLRMGDLFGEIEKAHFDMIPHVPTKETIGAFSETAKTIISSVCAERFDPSPSYQTCRFCDYADLCGVGRCTWILTTLIRSPLIGGPRSDTSERLHLHAHSMKKLTQQS